MSRKWIIEHFTRSFFGYDRFIMMFLSDQMFCFDVILFTWFLLRLFMWILSEISVVLSDFMIQILSEICYDVIYYFFVWLTCNRFTMVLFLYDCSIIFCNNSMIFRGLSWFIVSCFLIDILINMIVCNALYYKGL